VSHLLKQVSAGRFRLQTKQIKPDHGPQQTRPVTLLYPDRQQLVREADRVCG